jgi:hypothetical protein
MLGLDRVITADVWIWQALTAMANSAANVTAQARIAKQKVAGLSNGNGCGHPAIDPSLKGRPSRRAPVQECAISSMIPERSRVLASHKYGGSVFPIKEQL